MIPDDAASTTQSPSYSGSEGVRDDQLAYDYFVTASFRLSEIVHYADQNYFSPSRTQNCSGEPASFLESSTTEDKMAHILRSDGCLRRWVDSLPASLKYGSPTSLRDATTTRQSAVLHLR